MSTRLYGQAKPTRASSTTPVTLGTWSRPRLAAPGPGPLQTKLTINQPGERYEQEADRVAEQIMCIPEPGLQRRMNEEKKKERLQTKPHIQRRFTSGKGNNAAPPIVEEVLRSPGRPLEQTTRRFMEPRFGHSFSRVRVHTDTKAADSAWAMNAKAFTVGQDMIFGADQYNPQSKEGKSLLAHELTHVVQQNGIRSHDIQRHPAVGAGFPSGSTNFAFDTYNLRESHLSDPDIIARFNAMARDQLIAYRNEYLNHVPDPSVLAYIDGLIASGTPVLQRVEVASASRDHFAQVPGTGAGTHWVSVASRTAEKPKVLAVVTPAVSPTDSSVAGLIWTGQDVTPNPANPLEAEVERTAGRRQVTATLGGVSESTTLWSVFATIRATTGPNDTFNANATRARPGAEADFEATIHPASILTDADRPRLDGPNDSDPPGGTHIPTGNPLAGGADHHWDFSRKSRTRLINPNGIPLNSLVVPGDTAAANILNNAPWDYPSTWEEGNDDASPLDENNDPYAGPMTSHDGPGLLISHSGGADGDTFERRLHFREFVRLEINRRWWVISHHFPWRVHMRVQKVGGRWENNGTDAAADNSGF
jgi:hypothetical protein